MLRHSTDSPKEITAVSLLVRYTDNAVHKHTPSQTNNSVFNQHALVNIQRNNMEKKSTCLLVQKKEYVHVNREQKSQTLTN